MKKPMLALLAVLSCAAFAPSGARAADDGPDLKETLTWLKRYLNEEAGGQFGADLPADAPSGATGPRYAYSYVWTDKDWSSPEEATADWQITFTDRSNDKSTETDVSLKLKGLSLNSMTVASNKLGGFWLTIPANEAVSLTRDGAAVRASKCSILFPTQDAAKKACRALRRAAVLAGAVEVADPFASDTPKDPVTRPSDPPVTTPPPDDGKAARRAALDGEIATTADAVSDGEQKLSGLNDKILGARLVVVAADAAYQNAESGSFDEAAAAAALAVAQGVLDDLNAQRDAVESNLEADRVRYNQLKRERDRLGD